LGSIRHAALFSVWYDASLSWSAQCDPDHNEADTSAPSPTTSKSISASHMAKHIPKELTYKYAPNSSNQQCVLFFLGNIEENADTSPCLFLPDIYYKSSPHSLPVSVLVGNQQPKPTIRNKKKTLAREANFIHAYAQ
jgi:hypothetical protein